MRLSKLIYASAALAAVLGAAPARAEVQLWLYSGDNIPYNSDVTVQRPGTNTTFTVPWQSKPFIPTYYYGWRATYWLDNMPNLGFGVDFTHAKLYANPRVNWCFSGWPDSSLLMVGSTVWLLPSRPWGA